MIPEYASRTAFRLSREERAKIDALINAGKYQSISKILRTALQEFLAREEQKT